MQQRPPQHDQREDAEQDRQRNQPPLLVHVVMLRRDLLLESSGFLMIAIALSANHLSVPRDEPFGAHQLAALLARNLALALGGTLGLRARVARVAAAVLDAPMTGDVLAADDAALGATDLVAAGDRTVRGLG